LRELVAQHDPVAEKPVWLEFFMNTVNEGEKRLSSGMWQVIDAPLGLEFVTSDVGIVKFVGGFNQPCTWRLGFSFGVSHWVIPIGAARALAIRPSYDQREFRPTRSIIKAINKRMVLDANRFVFSKQFHAFVEKWWLEPGSRTADLLLPPK
jgi:hypothetical protein